MPLPAFTDNSPLNPISLDPRPTPEQAARAFAAYCAASPHYRRDALLDIGAAYAVACDLAGLDTWLTLGQVAYETGKLTSWWSARPRRNPAGIGVNGQSRKTAHPTDPEIWPYQSSTQRFVRGYSYPRWVYDPDHPGETAAVDAHVSRLLWYAQLAPFSPDQKLLMDRGRAWGMPDAARGSARTPRELGWAFNRAKARMMGWAFPGWTYGRGIAKHANALRGLQ